MSQEKIFNCVHRFMTTSCRVTYGEVVVVYEFIHTESTLSCRHPEESGNSTEGVVLVQCYNSRIWKILSSTQEVLYKRSSTGKSETRTPETALRCKTSEIRKLARLKQALQPRAHGGDIIPWAGLWTEEEESKLSTSIHLSLCVPPVVCV